MADIEQIKAQLMACSAKLKDAAAGFQHGTSYAEEAQHMLQASMEGSSQADYNECHRVICKAMVEADDASAAAALAAQRAEDMAARL